MRLPRKYSMTERADFSRVRKTGRAKPGRFVILSTLEDPELESIRTGFITTKRSGKAHERVLLRRWFRALVQEHVPAFENPNRFLVTIARPGANKASYAEIAKDWAQQARRLGLFASNEKKS